MKQTIKQIYEKDKFNAGEAQFQAHAIAFAPVVFQISRLMLKFGILELLFKNKNGLKFGEILNKTKISEYGLQILLESSLTANLILFKDKKYFISNVGHFLLRDDMARIDMDFIHEVCYQGLFSLEEALASGKPSGLSVFGEWNTIYEALSKLPRITREKWLAFDHYYSDNAFNEALKIIFSKPIKRLLDVGGNTGRFAKACVAFNENVEVCVMDLVGQVGLMKEAIKGAKGSERISGVACDLLDGKTQFVSGYDAIWFSQFLDCFCKEEVVSILSRAAKSMDKTTNLYILEPLWDRQKYETAAFDLTQTSVYFTAIANGNSKIFKSSDLFDCIKTAGLKIGEINDGLGLGSSLIRCALA